jgi:hypothetical protein
MPIIHKYSHTLNYLTDGSQTGDINRDEVNDDRFYHKLMLRWGRGFAVPVPVGSIKGSTAMLAVPVPVGSIKGSTTMLSVPVPVGSTKGNTAMLAVPITRLLLANTLAGRPSTDC